MMDILQPLIRYMRSDTDSKFGVFNGVAVRELKRHDQEDTLLVYSAHLVNAIRYSVKTRDVVTVVGGDNGVAPIVAARAVGPYGGVICYESSREASQSIEQTVWSNRMANRCDVEHITGQTGYEGIKSLPMCDVLILNCGRSIHTILETLEIRPRVVIVSFDNGDQVDRNRILDALAGQSLSIEREIEMTKHSSDHMILASNPDIEKR